MPGYQQGAEECGRRENPDFIEDVPMHHIDAVQMGHFPSLPLFFSTQYVYIPPFLLLEFLKKIKSSTSHCFSFSHALIHSLRNCLLSLKTWVMFKPMNDLVYMNFLDYS